MTLSIIVPSLNSLIIDRVIAALQRQTVQHEVGEIIVVGQDQPKRLSTRTGIHFIETPQPISAAAARNLGARQATGEWLLFTDADCIAAPDWAEQLLACFAQGHAVVGGGVNIAPESSAYWTLCDNLLTLSASLVKTSLKHTSNMWYLPSLNFGIRRALFLSIGGFDETFPGAAGEDVDLSLRLQQQGADLHFAPAAQIIHRPARTTARALWRHLWAFGAAHDRIQQQFGAVRPSPLNRLSPRWHWAIALAAPLLAAKDVATLFAHSPVIRQHPRAVVGLWWGKLGWYAGLTHAMQHRAAQAHTDPISNNGDQP